MTNQKKIWLYLYAAFRCTDKHLYDPFLNTSEKQIIKKSWKVAKAWHSLEGDIKINKSNNSSMRWQRYSRRGLQLRWFYATLQRLQSIATKMNQFSFLFCNNRNLYIFFFSSKWLFLATTFLFFAVFLRWKNSSSRV